MSTQNSPHLGSLIFKAIRPARFVVTLWSVLAAFTFWGKPRTTVWDAFAISYNSNTFIGVLLGVALLGGSLQILARLVPAVAETMEVIGRIIRKPVAGLPLYTQRQLGSLARTILATGLVFYVLGRVRSGDTWTLISAGLAQLPIQLPTIVIQGMLLMVFFVLQFVLLFAVLGRGGVTVLLPEEIKTNFSTVWGQDAILEKVREVVEFLKRPEIIESRGGHVPGGVLLWGPPGTGKTLIAEAVAGETSTPFVIVEPAAFQAMFVGIGPMKVKNLYRKLRKLSEVYGGVVVFFDEADVLGSRGRGGGDNTLRSEPRTEKLRAVMPSMGGDLGVLNAILASMQGIKTPRGLGNRVRRVLGLPVKAAQAQRILHIMATNMPNSLDPALLRPGRIDRIFRVGYPSRAGRLATFQGYLAKVPHELNEMQINELATMTVNATGAVIKDMVNEALIAALREGRESISWVDILTAKRLKEFGPPEGVEYVPFERHAVAVHEACHALAAWRLRSHLTIDTVTIEKGQDYLGMVASRPTEDLFTRWASEYRVDIAVALSSLAGEKLFFGGDSTSGVAADLDQATRLAALMTGRWGMSEQIAAQVPLAEAGMEGPETARRQVEALLASVFSEVTEMLSRDRHLVLSLAHALEYERTLSGVDVVAVFEQRRGLLYDGSIYRGEHAENTLNAYHALLVRSRSTAEEVPSPLDVFAQLKETFESGVWPDREPSEGYRPDGDEDAVDIDSESPPSWPDWPAEPDSTL